MKTCENEIRKYQESNASFELLAQREKCKNIELLADQEQLKRGKKNKEREESH